MWSERVQFHLLKVGHCRHPQCMTIRGGNWKSINFPSLCALIRHPQRGWMLYDTGYAEHFFSATNPFPERMYRLVTPADLPESECLLTQLAALGVSANEIGHVLISHFHGDHIAGLRDFPTAQCIAMRADWEQVKSLGRVRGVADGFLRALLPQGFVERLRFADDAPRRELSIWLAPFEYGFDLFGDGSLVAIPLPGHSRAQMGLLLRDEHDQLQFLTADACWSLPACRDGRLPSALASVLFASRRDYQTTFFGLGRIARELPEVSLLPSHCELSWQEWRRTHV